MNTCLRLMLGAMLAQLFSRNPHYKLIISKFPALFTVQTSSIWHLIQAQKTHSSRRCWLQDIHQTGMPARGAGINSEPATSKHHYYKLNAIWLSASTRKQLELHSFSGAGASERGKRWVWVEKQSSHNARVSRLQSVCVVFFPPDRGKFMQNTRINYAVIALAIEAPAAGRR